MHASAKYLMNEHWILVEYIVGQMMTVKNCGIVARPGRWVRWRVHAVLFEIPKEASLDWHRLDVQKRRGESVPAMRNCMWMKSSVDTINGTHGARLPRALGGAGKFDVYHAIYHIYHVIYHIYHLIYRPAQTKFSPRCISAAGSTRMYPRIPGSLWRAGRQMIF